LDRLAACLTPGRPVVPIIFYRALLLASDTAAIDALCKALSTRGLAPAPFVITSLKEATAAAFIRDALARLRPAVIVTTTAFAAGGNPGEPTPLDGPDVPVLQAVIATTRRAAWRESSRGLGAADLAMHVVLPELDGRVLAGAIAFKDSLSPHTELAFTALANRPEPDRIAAVADRVAALAHLQATPRAERRIAILMPDYPGAPGRTGYAVGLDVPASIVALLGDIEAVGYGVRDAPRTSGALLDALNPPRRGRTAEGSRRVPRPYGAEGQQGQQGVKALSPPPGLLKRADLPPPGAGDLLHPTSDCAPSLPLAAYMCLAAGLPTEVTTRVYQAWGDPADDPDVNDGAFRFRVVFCGNVIVALPPERGRSADRRADYHDPELPPRH